MPNRFNRTAALAVAASLLLAPAAAVAKSGTSEGEGSGHSCSDPYPASAKKPFDKGAIADTEGCFKNFVTQTEQLTKTVQGFASGCKDAADTRAQQGELLGQLAGAGHQAVDITKKAKVKYFKAQESYYTDVHYNDVMQRKLGKAVNAIGKVSLDIDGFYTRVAGIGSAMSNDDCGEAETKAGAAAKATAEARTDYETLISTLAALKQK